ncbi:MAG: ABC transporter permease [Clostridiales bacterium]|nr:ABC transporter permease [Clostridiales bacterium]
MGNSIIIAKNFILQISKNKINFLVYVLLPPILAVMFMLFISNTSSQAINIGIVDNDNSAASKHLSSYIENSDSYNISFYEKELLIKAITNKKIKAGIIIPKNFEKLLKEGEPTEVLLYSIEGVSVLGWLENFLNQKIANLSLVGPSNNYEKILNSYTNSQVSLIVYEVGDIASKMDATQTGFGMYVFASIFAIWGICALTYNEKIYKTYHRIMSSPVSSIEFVFGNILSSFFFAILHLAISLPIIYLIFNIGSIISIKVMIILMICLYIVTISLGTLLVSLARSQSSVMAINIFVLTITSMLGGCYWPIEFMPKFMRSIATITPQYWFNTAIIKLFKSESIIFNIIMMLAFAIIYILIYLIINKFKKQKV